MLGALADGRHRRRGLARDARHLRVELVVGQQLARGPFAGRHAVHEILHVRHDAAGRVHEQRAGVGHLADVFAHAVDELDRGLDGLAEAGERLGHLLAQGDELVGDGPERLAALLDEVGHRHGVGAGQPAAVGNLGRGLGARPDLDEHGAQQAVGHEGRHRVGTYQRVQVLAYPHADHEPPAGRRRDGDANDLARGQPGQTDVGADLHPADVAEVGIHLELLGEQQPPVADHEQPDREHQQSADHERAYQRQAWGTHRQPPSIPSVPSPV